MCGIGGILRTDGQPIPEEWLDIIDARIAYRGPDGCGRFRDRVEIEDSSAPNGKRIVEVAFVHRRLSIIDHAGGHQPMVSERGRNDSEGLVAVVFNGCIYNHRELRMELEAKGHTFISDHSDTEVLIHGWREWGAELASHLEGMHAFAIWDRGRRWLVLSRDCYGEKPLYMVSSSGTIGVPDVVAFASECASLAKIEANGFGPQSVPEYLLVGYPNLRSEEWPGVTEIVESVGPPDLDMPCFRTTALCTDKLSFEELIERAVKRRLEADVPLGCFLSGGVDSSLITHFAKKHKPDVMTFAVRMPDKRYDESAMAEAAAKYIGTNHMTLDAAPSPAEDLVLLIQTLGLPFGDSSILPTYWVSKAARQFVKVAISGDGGDELFLGYERYKAAQALSDFRFMLKLFPAATLHRAHPKSFWNKLARLTDMARDYESIGLIAMECIFRPGEIRTLIGGNLEQLPRPEGGTGALRSLQSFDMKNYLPGDLLRKVDTASMANALEVRCPFLDRDLARAALAAPKRQLMPKGQRKGLLRNIARKYLPKEIVDRPKMGFAIPIGEWFRTDYGGMKALLLDHLNSAEPFGPISLNRKAVQRFIDEHMSEKRDHGQRLFTLLTLSIWAKTDSNALLNSSR